jgi:nucleotide-binding universal stress UspA family protein
MKILVPLDFSENSLKALEFAIGLADKKHGKIILVHVVELVYDFASQSALALDSMFNDAESLMNKTIKTYEGSGISMESKVVEGTAAVSIARFAEEQDVALIVMGTQGASGIKKTLMGTVTVNVVKEASCPVLVVPAKAKISEVRKVSLALEFANHEEEFMDWMVDMSKRWSLGFEILHIQTSQGFKEDLSLLGIESYLAKKYPGLPTRIHTFYAENTMEGLDLYLDEHEDMILVMCHEHRNLWEQIIKKSHSIQMAYHTHIPLLILV